MIKSHNLLKLKEDHVHVVSVIWVKNDQGCLQLY